MMRRLFVLFAAAALVCAIVAATAYALTNNDVSFTGTLTHKGKPSKAKPAPASFHTITDFKTTDNKQPNVADTTTIFFPKQLLSNGKYFPSCSKAEIDGVTTIPAKCKKAIVGSGRATAAGGVPGTTQNPVLAEQLSVVAYNGSKGKSLLLVLNGTSPLNIRNRVVEGKMSRASGKFGFKLTFTTPDDLQFQQGLQTPQTHFDIKIKSITTKAKVHGKKTKVPYLGLTACPKSHKLPTRTTVNFAQDGPLVGNPPHPQPGGQVVTRDGTVKC
jgi:hypothetical protein